MLECAQARSSNWQSSGLQIRGLGVRIPPGLPFSFAPSVNTLAAGIVSARGSELLESI